MRRKASASRGGGLRYAGSALAREMYALSRGQSRGVDLGPRSWSAPGSLPKSVHPDSGIASTRVAVEEQFLWAGSKMNDAQILDIQKSLTSTTWALDCSSIRRLTPREHVDRHSCSPSGYWKNEPTRNQARTAITVLLASPKSASSSGVARTSGIHRTERGYRIRSSTVSVGPAAGRSAGFDCALPTKTEIFRSEENLRSALCRKSDVGQGRINEKAPPERGQVSFLWARRGVQSETRSVSLDLRWLAVQRIPPAPSGPLAFADALRRSRAVRIHVLEGPRPASTRSSGRNEAMARASRRSTKSGIRPTAELQWLYGSLNAGRLHCAGAHHA
jgi:hypothetical protein